MKKNKLLLASLALVGSLVGCGIGNPSSSEPAPGPGSSDAPSSEKSEEVKEEVSQGVGEGKILVGNAAATSGAFATVGGPFNAGLEAAFKAYNDAGGFGEEGLKIELKHYDDGFDGAKGATYTEKLIEEDEVFALVGHFGTPTVEATLDTIKEKGIPMVYAATGVSGLFNEKAEGNERAVMSVQPIYDAEGQVLLARAVAKTEGNMGLGGKKIGVISTTDDAGKGMLNGIKLEATKLGISDITYVTTASTPGTNHGTPVQALKNAGCDVVIIAANQAPFAEIMSYFKTGGYDNVKVITSYVSANTDLAKSLVDSGAITETREAYATAWLDIADTYVYAPDASNTVGTGLWAGYKIYDDTLGLPTFYDAGVPGFSEEYWTVAEAIFAWGLENDPTAAWALSFNSYALAGYIAGHMFIEGLDRVEEAGKVLNWKNYIDAMESAPYDFPMGGAIDLANGARYGIQDLALNKLTKTALGAGSLEVYSGITTLKAVEAAK